MTAWWVLAAVVVVVLALGAWAWRSSGRARPRFEVTSTEAAAQYVNRDAPHTSSTCQQSGFDQRLGF